MTIEQGSPKDWIEDEPCLSKQASRMYSIDDASPADWDNVRQVDTTNYDVPNITALARQEGGSHYKDMAIQPVEFIHRNKLGFCEGNVVKYVCRYGAKNGLEDLRKARHYIDLLIQMETEQYDRPHHLKEQAE